MKTKVSDHYLKIVEWSEEDRCYIGTAPGLIIGGVHGKSQNKVFADLCKAVDAAIAALEKEGLPLPPETADKTFSGKIALRIPPELHKALAIKAGQAGESINRFIQQKLKAA